MRTSASGWVRSLWLLAGNRGLDAATLFQQADMNPAGLDDPLYRYPQDNITRLWSHLVALTGDPGIGLQFGQSVNASTFNAIGYVMQSSRTLAEALEFGLKYQQWLSEATRMTLSDDNDQIYLSLSNEGDQQLASTQSIEAALSAIVHFSRWILQGPLTPLKIRIGHAPTVPLDHYQRLLGCPVEFKPGKTCLVFPRYLLDRRLPGADPTMQRVHLNFIGEQTQAQQRPFTTQVEQVVGVLLPLGEARMERVAKQLHCSVKTLQRRLLSEGVTFSDLVDALIFETACGLLRQSHLELSDVAQRCGYADYSAFNKAFRRKSGKTPKTWRQHFLGE